MVAIPYWLISKKPLAICDFAGFVNSATIADPIKIKNKKIVVNTKDVCIQGDGNLAVNGANYKISKTNIERSSTNTRLLGKPEKKTN